MNVIKQFDPVSYFRQAMESESSTPPPIEMAYHFENEILERQNEDVKRFDEEQEEYNNQIDLEVIEALHGGTTITHTQTLHELENMTEIDRDTAIAIERRLPGVFTDVGLAIESFTPYKSTVNLRPAIEAVKLNGVVVAAVAVIGILVALVKWATAGSKPKNEMKQLANDSLSVDAFLELATAGAKQLKDVKKGSNEWVKLIKTVAESKHVNEEQLGKILEVLIDDASKDKTVSAFKVMLLDKDLVNKSKAFRTPAITDDQLLVKMKSYNEFLTNHAGKNNQTNSFANVVKNITGMLQNWNLSEITNHTGQIKRNNTATFNTGNVLSEKEDTKEVGNSKKEASVTDAGSNLSSLINSSSTSYKTIIQDFSKVTGVPLVTANEFGVAGVTEAISENSKIFLSKAEGEALLTKWTYNKEATLPDIEAIKHLDTKEALVIIKESLKAANSVTQGFGEGIIKTIRDTVKTVKDKIEEFRKQNSSSKNEDAKKNTDNDTANKYGQFNKVMSDQLEIIFGFVTKYCIFVVSLSNVYNNYITISKTIVKNYKKAIETVGDDKEVDVEEKAETKKAESEASKPKAEAATKGKKSTNNAKKETKSTSADKAPLIAPTNDQQAQQSN